MGVPVLGPLSGAASTSRPHQNPPTTVPGVGGASVEAFVEPYTSRTVRTLVCPSLAAITAGGFPVR